MNCRRGQFIVAAATAQRPGTRPHSRVTFPVFRWLRCRRSVSTVTSSPWAPFSRRTAGLGPDNTVHDGLPGYLRGVLQDWVAECYPDDRWGEWTQLRNILQFRLRLDKLPSPPEFTDDQLLDVIDALLAHWLEPGRLVNDLDELLTTGGAGWRVTAARTGLERRVDATVTAAVAVAIRAAPTDTGGHLAAAWAAAYGRNPDPDRAYDEAVLAVESVACPLVCPSNSLPTLGTVIRDLGGQSVKWALVIGDKTGQPASPDRLIEILKLLWEGQSRHAGAANSRSQSQPEAEAAVHLGATLVQWLSSGVLYRR